MNGYFETDYLILRSMLTTSSLKLEKAWQGDGCYSLETTPTFSVVLSVIQYALTVLMLNKMQMDRLERIQNEAMRVILRTTRNMAIAAMWYLLDMLRICRI